jgi:PleD family two-component response regulator
MSKNVIIVEDDSVAARYVELCLRRLGHQEIRTASSSATALEMVREKAPDLVLMDIEIDGGPDGVETAITLRKQFNVPSIFLTSRSDEMTVARAKRAEPLGYLVKPIKSEELRSTIAIGLHKERLDRETKEREQQARQGGEPEVRRLRAELALQSTHDDATGLLNQRGFALLGEHQLRLMRRLKSAASMVRVQVLNLAEIDTEFGDGAATQALKDLADILRGLQRDGDLSGYLDTAQFSILSPGAASTELASRTSAAIDVHNMMAARAWKLAVLCTDAHCAASEDATIQELLRRTESAQKSQTA